MFIWPREFPLDGAVNFLLLEEMDRATEKPKEEPKIETPAGPKKTTRRTKKEQ